MWYLKTNAKSGSKAGDYQIVDILNAIKVGLIVNSINCNINQAQDETQPSLDWLRATLGKMYHTVSHFCFKTNVNPLYHIKVEISVCSIEHN